MNKTAGISPKLIASAITGIVTFLITKLGLQADPVLEQAISVTAMLIAAYIAPPGNVKPERV